MKKGARKAAKRSAAAKTSAAKKPAAKKAASTKARAGKGAAAKKPVKTRAKAAPAKTRAKAAPAKTRAKAAPAKTRAKAAPAKKRAAKPAPAKTRAAKAPPANTRTAKAAPASSHVAQGAPAKPAQQELALDAGTPLAAHAGRAMIIQILGDAEAYFIDFARLSEAQRRELVEHHLAAWDARKRAEGEAAWFETFVPVALIGESMPPVVRGRFDLSAPHEGVVLFHRPTGALLHASSKDDDQLALMAPDVEAISPTESYIDEVFDPGEQSYAYSVDRTESQGFTRSEIVTMMQAGGAELILV